MNSSRKGSKWKSYHDSPGLNYFIKENVKYLFMPEGITKCTCFSHMNIYF